MENCNKKYTIEMWLKGMVDYPVPESAMMAILFNNNVEGDSYVEQVPEKQRELCLADLYLWLASSSTTSSAESVSDNGWSHHKAIRNVADRRGLRVKAKQLYAKWGSEKANQVGSDMIFKDLY